jgi:hypothetical protein
MSLRREEEGLGRELKWEESERNTQKESGDRGIKDDDEMIGGGVNKKKKKKKETVEKHHKFLP